MKRSHSSPLSFLFPGRSPLAILFAIVDGGIEVQLFQNNQLLKDWQPSQLQHVLPEPLIRWMEDQRIHIGPQPYPLIKQFWQSLIPHISKKLLVDSSILAGLVEGPQPQDFALVWELNRSLERIEGRYEGADRYLGMGWFQKGMNIWSLSKHPSVELDIFLKDLIYPLRHATVILESNIPYLRQYLPTRAHFQVITDFVPQVIAHNVSSSAVTLGLQCNYPQLLSTIRVPKGGVDALLAARAVIQFPRQALTPVMAYLLQSGSAITLEGESIPLFIREQLPVMLRHHQISDDLAAKINQAHPVVSIPTLKPIVSLAHTFENGIGTYSISAIYKYQQHVLDIDALLNAYQRSQRFVRQHGIWFEWSENARGFVDTLLQQRASVLRPEEVMGFDTQRLALLPDQAPACTIKPVGATYVERARSVFTQLRQHGIPGGIVAPHQAGLTIMLETAWEELVRDNPQARILWVVPSKKREAVASLIQSRHVTVASPGTLREEPELVSHAWTLVIFQELDYLLEAEHASEICSKILYVWATFSIASKSALTPAILRVLHVPEKYCEQFGAYYLFDPLKGSADIVASNRSAELSRAQKESRQSEMEKPAASGSIAIPDAFGRSDEVQREKIAQYLEMLKQNRVRRTLSSTAPAIRPFLPSKPKIEQAVSNGSAALPASLRIHDERDPDLTIARKAFLTVTGKHISNLNNAHQALLNVIDKRVSILGATQENAEIQRETVEASSRLYSTTHAQTPLAQTQRGSQIVASTTSKAPSKESVFFAQATQWVGRTHDAVPMVSFKCHVPAYSDMDARQLAWYFYWRNEVRHGRYPTTELSYILVHVYETLACVGFADPMQAYERLVALWRQYRASFPLLDQYLIPWIADFCRVHTLPRTPMQWYTQLLRVPDCAVDVQLMAEAWWRQGGKWAEIPPTVLYKLVGFEVPQKLSQDTQQKKALDEAYLLAIAEVDRYVSHRSGPQALMKRYGRNRTQTIERQPFQGSLWEGSYRCIIVATIHAVFDDVEFCRAVLGILKYADYIQRKLYQNKAERFVPTIDMSWQKAIETALIGRSLSQAKHTASQNQRSSSTVFSQSSQVKANQQADQNEDDQPTEKLPSVKQNQTQQVSSSSVAPATGASRATGGTDSAVPESVERKPASVSKRRSIELDQHTIVRLLHESEQLRERLIVEDEEDPRPLSSVTQQNVDALGEIRDLPRAEAKPVPEKVVPHEEVAVRPDVNQDQKKEPALPATRTEALSFWDQARQWKDRSHGLVPLEKFKHYHPDYTLMNTSQLNWYFYWRSEVRSGRYPATDVGYIFIHAYEALGCIGFTNPTQACDRLFSLWKHYRESFADLDKYLVPWIADFCVVHTVPLTPMQWYTQVLALSDSDIDAQLVAEAWLHQGGDWTQIPTTVLYKLVGFNTRTNFYQKMRQKYALDDGYKRAIAAVDNYLSAKFDRPALITQYGKGKLQAVEREPFKWALVEQAYAPITVAHINAAFTDAGFLQALSGILKYADHVQRKLYQNAVSSFAPTIDVNWQEAIEAVLTNKPSGQSKEAQRQTVSNKTLPAVSPELQKKEALVKPVRAKTSATLNVDLVVTSSRQPSTSGSYIEERVAVMKQYWRHFDEIHSRQAEGMAPLYWGPILNPLSIGFEHHYLFYKPDPHPLFQRHLPANLLSEIERLWGTTMLPRWPERIVSEPFPHEVLIKAFGVALSFWHSCGLNVWFFCEGTLYLDDLSKLEDFYRKEIQWLEDMGMPVNRRLFQELGKASKKLIQSQPIEHNAPRGGFEGIRDIVTSYRRLWADAYLDRYIRVRWEADVRKVEVSYSTFANGRGGAPPTIKQFARDARNATNYWFGGDISRMYEAIGAQAPLQPQQVTILPADRLTFALAVFNTLKAGLLKSQQATRNTQIVERGDYQLNQLAEFGLWYVQMEEALGYAPVLTDFSTGKFTSNSEVLNRNLPKAWAVFVSAVELAKKELRASEEVQKPVKAESQRAEATSVKIEKTARYEEPAPPSPIQPAVQLSIEAISRLKAESDQLQGRLTIEEEEREQQSPQIIFTLDEEPIAFAISNLSIPESEVDEEWKGIAQQWQPEHWEVMRLLYHAQHKDLVLVERQTRRPLSQLIDEINSPVEEVLSDLLIDPDTKTIASHLQAIVETLLRTTHKSIESVIERSEVKPVTPVRGDIFVSKLEVDEGWKGIAQQWGPEHWEVIRLLHQGKQTDLTSVERRVHRPVSRLIDEVNSPVEEVLGDLLIDPDTRMIADHLQATLEVLLGWYRASKGK